jgi:hypothetical protein
MVWKAYILTYRAVTPILLGYHPLGFIQRTRYYAPGWTLWGAITAQLTRACLPKATGKDYEAVGCFVAENLPTSYAFILVDGEPTWTHFIDGRLHYGPLAAAEFEARFVTSWGQTAVVPGNLTAQTGTLHETEALTAHDLVSGEPVRWRLTLYVRQPWQGVGSTLKDLKLEDVLAALKSLTLGADRGYGLGCLEREGEPELQPVEGGKWPRPLEKWGPAKRVLRAHVPMEDLPGEAVRGRAEPIPWLWWQNSPSKDGWGPGQLRKLGLFYAPGSWVELETWEPVVGPRGIWLKERSGAPSAPS